MHEGPQAAIATREPTSVLERAAREAERWDLGVWVASPQERRQAHWAPLSQGGCGLGPKQVKRLHEWIRRQGKTIEEQEDVCSHSSKETEREDGQKVPGCWSNHCSQAGNLSTSLCIWLSQNVREVGPLSQNRHPPAKGRLQGTNPRCLYLVFFSFFSSSAQIESCLPGFLARLPTLDRLFLLFVPLTLQ